jgi:hypothetical protein
MGKYYIVFSSEKKKNKKKKKTKPHGRLILPYKVIFEEKFD